MSAVTGQTLINNSLTMLGILEQGGTPSASESNDSLAELNAMWNGWSIDEGLIFSVSTFNGTLVTATSSYTIGSGATFDTPVPQRIYSAFFVSGNNRNELDIVDHDAYYKHNDLNASCATPDQIYMDYNISPSTGFATVFIWPVPTFVSGTFTLQLENAATFSNFSLGTTYNIPYGYQDAIQYALAWRLIPRYGLIVPDIIKQEIAGLAEKAELRIRTMNASNRQKPLEQMTLQPPQPTVVAPRA